MNMMTSVIPTPPVTPLAKPRACSLGKMPKRDRRPYQLAKPFADFGRDGVTETAVMRGLRSGCRPHPTARAAIIAYVERLIAGKAVRHG